MSKKFAKVDMIENAVVAVYNHEEFSNLCTDILLDFCSSRNIDPNNVFSIIGRSKYCDAFISWYNKTYFLAGKRTTTFVYRNEDGVIYKEKRIKPQRTSYAKILKRNKETYTVSYINPEHIFFNYSDLFIFYRISQMYQPKPILRNGKVHKFWLQKHRYPGAKQAHHFEKYYAKLNDSKYYKNNGEPLPRRMHGTLGTRNTWEDWEDECVSTKGNWKHSTKDKHQWEHRLKLKEPKNIEVVKEDPYTLAVYDWNILNNIFYDQLSLDILDYPWLYKDFNVIPDPSETETLYNKEHNKDETE